MFMFAQSLRRYPARSIQSLLRQHAGQRSLSVTALRLKDQLSEAVKHVDYDRKYAAKLERRAAELGITVEKLRAQIREKDRREREVRRATLEKHSSTGDPAYASSEVPEENEDSSQEVHDKPVRQNPLSSHVRKDSSPVKPLSSILLLDKLFETEHTAEQVSVLWRAYHASRSKGTGRGYLCATVPVDSYKHMLEVATRYPTFILPIARANAQTDEPVSEGQQPTEFFFMQWDFHGAPPDPKPKNDIFARPTISKNPQTSTVLFTPLQEYKLRGAFATPHLVITHYPDLVESHGLVLLRGEITPSSGNNGAPADDSRYLLSQQDAQLLALGVQRFYLWSQGHEEREALLKRFHENPSEFQWEDLLKHAEVSS